MKCEPVIQGLVRAPDGGEQKRRDIHHCPWR
jgi:hypothetical protein